MILTHEWHAQEDVNLPYHSVHMYINPQKCQFALDISELNLMYYFKNKCEGFIRFPNARKHLKPHGCRPSGFVVFKCLETWWNLKHEFLKWLFQRNNTKLCSVLFFPFFFKMPCMCDLLYSLCLWAFVFNYPIVFCCTKFVFQKHCELEVIYMLFLPWTKEGFASQKQLRKKNFA